MSELLKLSEVKLLMYLFTAGALFYPGAAMILLTRENLFFSMSAFQLLFLCINYSIPVYLANLLFCFVLSQQDKDDIMLKKLHLLEGAAGLTAIASTVAAEAIIYAGDLLANDVPSIAGIYILITAILASWVVFGYFVPLKER